ncbi:hypothetical protein, partial [Mesorhizobium intechi]|uniref:hypothetical protein n=1 Tax=Mesorhizobium intechi TaxID=537601 RepID=UPI001AC00A59
GTDITEAPVLNRRLLCVYEVALAESGGASKLGFLAPLFVGARNPGSAWSRPLNPPLSKKSRHPRE